MMFYSLEDESYLPHYENHDVITDSEHTPLVPPPGKGVVTEGTLLYRIRGLLLVALGSCFFSIVGALTKVLGRVPSGTS